MSGTEVGAAPAVGRNQSRGCETRAAVGPTGTEQQRQAASTMRLLSRLMIRVCPDVWRDAASGDRWLRRRALVQLQVSTGARQCPLNRSYGKSRSSYRRHANTKQEKCLIAHCASPESIKLPRERMDGTQMPTKMPRVSSPVKKRKTDMTSDSRAAVMTNFLGKESPVARPRSQDEERDDAGTKNLRYLVRSDIQRSLRIPQTYTKPTGKIRAKDEGER